jgi:uncharacterized protein YeaO (DUF488 family)
MGLEANAGGRQPLSRNSLEKLSHDITQSSDVRKQFMADPEGFIKTKYGAAVSAAERDYVKNLQQMVADGFCCKGCGCSGLDMGKDVINPGIKGR